jgi:hypothetical protein
MTPMKMKKEEEISRLNKEITILQISSEKRENVIYGFGD